MTLRDLFVASGLVVAVGCSGEAPGPDHVLEDTTVLDGTGAAPPPGRTFDEPTQEGYVRASDGAQLYYRALGGPAADTVVVVHGGPGFDSDYLLPDLEPLADRFTLIAYDQRGAGRSTLVTDSTALALDDHVEDLEAVRTHFGIERLTLLGHSWGGLLAAAYGLRYPDNTARLVLSNPSPARRTPYLAELGPRLMAWMDSATLASVAQLEANMMDTTMDLQATCRAYWDVMARGYFADPMDTATIQGMKGDFCSSSGDALLNGWLVTRATLRSIGDWDWREDLQALMAPTLIVTGTDDTMPLEATREWASAMPNAEMVVLEDTGHYPHVERPEAYFRVVTDFLGR